MSVAAAIGWLHTTPELAIHTKAGNKVTCASDKAGTVSHPLRQARASRHAGAGCPAPCGQNKVSGGQCQSARDGRCYVAVYSLGLASHHVEVNGKFLEGSIKAGSRAAKVS
jgi:hypothetical protein